MIIPLPEAAITPVSSDHKMIIDKQRQISFKTEILLFYHTLTAGQVIFRAMLSAWTHSKILNAARCSRRDVLCRNAVGEDGFFGLPWSRISMIKREAEREKK